MREKVAGGRLSMLCLGRQKKKKGVRVLESRVGEEQKNM